MSALPPEADIGTQSLDVRFMPNGDICTAQKNQSANGHGRGCVPTQCSDL